MKARKRRNINTLSAIEVLWRVYERGVATPSLIAKDLSSTRQNAHQTLVKLLNKGLVARVYRGTYIATEKGKRLLRRIGVISKVDDISKSG